MFLKNETSKQFSEKNEISKQRKNVERIHSMGLFDHFLFHLEKTPNGLAVGKCSQCKSDILI